MKKLFIILCLILLVLVGCAQKETNITFEAVIESVNENNLMVSTSDDVGFDRASVSTKDADINFNPSAGAYIEITILPEVRESYPVQVTAVKISLMDKSINGINKASYVKISPEEAKAIMDKETVIVLDVRTQAEFDEGHIQNAVLLPSTEITTKAEALLPDKNAKILVYCRSGNRSSQASKALIELGYTDVLDFGGITDWSYGVVKN